MRVHSAHDPLAEASQWLDSGVLSGDHDVRFLISAGLGYALDEIERRLLPLRVVLFEPDAAMARLLFERCQWSEWIEQGRLAVLVGPDYAGLDAVARTFDAADAPPAHVHPVIERAWPADVSRAMDAVMRLRIESAGAWAPTPAAQPA